MRIVVIAAGRLRPPFVDDVEHYQKLLSRHARVELIEVRDDDRLPARVPKGMFISLLDREGEALDSVQFSRFLEERRQSGVDLAFAVGGPHGAEIDADHRLSLGPITLPHQLARVVLLEQLFRAHKILAGERYHY